MKLRIRTGNIEELIIAHDSIPEFNNPPLDTSEIINTRLKYKKYIILMAEINSEVVGFKAGYEKSEKEFYSWLGGVHPKYRQKGIATKLLEELENRIIKEGYKTLTFNTKNKFSAMISFGTKNGFNIFDFEKRNNIKNHRIYFKKEL